MCGMGWARLCAEVVGWLVVWSVDAWLGCLVGLWISGLMVGELVGEDWWIDWLVCCWLLCLCVGL